MTQYLATQPSAAADEDTRTRLLDAAIHIASTQGLDKVTYRSVAAGAGLSHSLVRFYFGTGEAMLTQALERAAMLDIAESHLNAGSIDEFGKDFLGVMAREHQRGMLQYDYLLRAARGGPDSERITAIYDYYIREISATLANLGIHDPEGSIAAMIQAAMDGLALQHAAYGSNERSERILERIRDMLRLLSGISSQTARQQ
ncbi:TetR/AcrR family transcriptional regulator [Arthrobacter sp. CAU 1506]|uniref:TetR/AcrR family transcriptional regulator n=1 Tax=Arthrobacter sp. CAU 1506 TaxID=2560052 RepID=UPI0010AB945A|nr:TetR/AcrR family transcriptional regulator [Arthrobacter sp. CAU 1506]TJY66258.1 TetR/AcrR family transcriptional regulator [Arthrobacter sp. CAU 1506]